MNICFLLWSPDISGGTNVIFEHAAGLMQLGNTVSIVCHERVCPERLTWFPGADKLHWYTFDEVESISFDVAIATWWRTVFSLKRVSAARYAYFVQSIESKFYEEDEVILRRLVDITYALNLQIITEATWIKEYLEKEYNKTAYLVKNGVRKQFFNTELPVIESRQSHALRVLVEGPLGVPFKNTELALELARASDAKEVWLLTSTEIAAYPKVDRLFSRIPISEVGRVYGSCDVLLKLSTVEGMFGPPLEAFHCGATSVTYDVTGFDEYIEHGFNGLVCYSRKDDDVIALINSLCRESGYLQKLKRSAVATANDWPNWEDSSKVFSLACQDILNQNSVVCIKNDIKIADHAWDMYEHSLKKNDYQLSKNYVLSVIKDGLKMKVPNVYSALRKVKWTAKAFTSS